MPEVSASAPGKIILFGEHAVVYGQPALAVPVHQVRAEARIEDGPHGSGLVINAADLNLKLSLAEAAAHALALMARLVLDALEADEPDVRITVSSTIPIASGLGSGAAVSAALGRALAQYLGQPLADARLSELVYEVEKLHHGTPSGIDNTVICYGQPVYFIREQPPQVFRSARRFDLLIGDTGVPAPTRETVGLVREAWQRNPAAYEDRFSQIGALVREARAVLEGSRDASLGLLMNRNQVLLRELGVSSGALERLIAAALAAGAEGAKLSGGGGGGNMIALAAPADVPRIQRALQDAGAVRVLHTVIEPGQDGMP